MKPNQDIQGLIAQLHQIKENNDWHAIKNIAGQCRQILTVRPDFKENNFLQLESERRQLLELTRVYQAVIQSFLNSAQRFTAKIC